MTAGAFGRLRERVAGWPETARYGLLFLSVAVLMHWPMFLGYVPIPADIITMTPLWDAFGIPFHQRYYGVMEDLVRSFYPGHRLIGEAIRSGQIPLWNPYVLNGYPMHAANAMAVFAPLTMLAWIFPIDIAWTAGMVIRPAFAALGAALLARAFGLRHAAALSAGFVFGWCGFNVGWAGQAMVDITVWLPWVMLGVFRVAQQPTPARIALAAIPFAVPHMSGHPEVAAYTTLVGMAAALLYLVCPPTSDRPVTLWRARIRAFWGLAAVGTLSLLLAAVQLLPTIEWIPQLKRELIGITAGMPYWDIMNFVYRHLAAAPINGIGSYIPNAAMYAGLVTLVILPAALMHRRWREVWFFVLMLLTALQFSFSWGPLVWLHHSMPVQVDFPKIRIIALADFSLAMLAGFAVSSLSEPRRRAYPWLTAASLLLAAGITVIQMWLPDAGPLIPDAADPFTLGRSIFQGRAFSVLLIQAAAILLVLPLIVPALRRHAGTYGPALCALIAVDMLTFAYMHVPFLRTDVLLATPPAIQFLQERVDDTSRILATRNTIPYNWEAQYRLATPQGYLYITRLMVDVMAPITLEPDPGIIELRLDRLLNTRSPIIDFLGVRYLVANHQDGSAEELAKYPDRFTSVYDDGSVKIFENPSWLPRARVIPCEGIEFQEFQRRSIARTNSPAFNHPTEVILHQKTRCPDDGADGETPSPPTELLEATFNTYAVRADVKSQSILVFADTYYEGWRAYIDGQETEVLRANHAFKAVRVDPGVHIVRFVFDPMSFKIGAAASILGLAIVAGLLAWSGARHRRGRSEGAPPTSS
ncbi:MAG: YfhO family protein [Chloroflexota bacterium]